MENQGTVALNKKDKKYFMHSAISIFIMISFGFIPPVEPITALGMRILGILIGVVYAWCTVKGVWPSLIALIFLGLTDYCTVPKAFLNTIGNSTIIYLLFLFIMGAVVAQSGVARVLAVRMINIKLTKGRPWVLTTMILLTTIILAATTSAIATMIVMWNLVYGICESVGYKKFDKWPSIMIYGIGYLSLVGSLFFPFQTGTASRIGIFEGMYEGFNLPYGPAMLVSGVLIVLIFISYLLVARFLVRPDMTPIMSYEVTDEKPAFTKDQKFAMGMIAAFVLLLLVPMLLPDDNPIHLLFNDIGTLGVVVFIVCCALFLRRKGEHIYNYNELSYKGIGWPTLFMVATAIQLSTALFSDASGIMQFILVKMEPLFGNMNEFAFIAVVSIFAIILTNFVNNIVLGITTLSLLTGFLPVLSINPLVAFMIFNFASQVGFFLPSGSPMAAMLYGNDWMQPKDIMKFTVLNVPVTLAVLLFIGIPWAGIVF